MSYCHSPSRLNNHLQSWQSKCLLNLDTTRGQTDNENLKTVTTDKSQAFRPAATLGYLVIAGNRLLDIVLSWIAADAFLLSCLDSGPGPASDLLSYIAFTTFIAPTYAPAPSIAPTSAPSSTPWQCRQLPVETERGKRLTRFCMSGTM